MANTLSAAKKLMFAVVNIRQRVQGSYILYVHIGIYNICIVCKYKYSIKVIPINYVYHLIMLNIYVNINILQCFLY